MKQDHQALLKYCPQHHAHRKTQKTHVTLTSDLWNSKGFKRLSR